MTEKEKLWLGETGYKKVQSGPGNSIHIYDCVKRKIVCNRWLEKTLYFRKTIYETPSEMLKACKNTQTICKVCMRRLKQKESLDEK